MESHKGLIVLSDRELDELILKKDIGSDQLGFAGSMPGKTSKHIKHSKNFPTDPWSIPQTPNQQFMKEFLSFGGERGCLGYAPGVCWGSLRNIFSQMVMKNGDLP